MKMNETAFGSLRNNNLKTLPGGSKARRSRVRNRGRRPQLGSSNVTTKPNKIEGIKVGRTAKKLHFLQGSGYNTTDDTVIGKYVIHYDDKTTAEIEVVYGKDVVDWWAYPDQKAPTKGKAVWEGQNEASKGFDAKIKLYAMTWENPKPDKRVATIDFIAPNPEQAAAPFCVAITAEDK